MIKCTNNRSIESNYRKRSGIAVKRSLWFFSMIIAVFLSGCASYDSLTENDLLIASGILDDQDYQDYVSLQSTGQLDAHGFYVGETFDDPIDDKYIDPGKVHVTFAENAYLDIHYYFDESLTDEIDTHNCYLMPGSQIYASYPVDNNPNINSYTFDRFEGIEYDSDGERGNAIDISFSDNRLIIQIPESFTGTDISIEPHGIIENRVLNFHDYYYSNAETDYELAGTWITDVGDDEITTVKESIEINPLASYQVHYYYDPTEYYFLNSTPQYKEIDEGSGIITFQEVFPEDSTDADNYAIELHHWVSVSVQTPTGVLDYMGALFSGNMTGIESVSVEGVERSSKESEIDHLKCGDRVIIDVSKGYFLSCNIFELDDPETMNDGSQRYTVVVQETYGAPIVLSVSKNTAEPQNELPVYSKAGS